jgi:hypothetical protein
MVWASTRPAEVTALNNMLASAPAWSSWGSGVHYPQIALPGDITPDTLPAALIVSESAAREGYAAGVKGLLSGSISIILYAPETVDSSTLESKARDIIDGLVNLYTGLANLSGSCGLASDPSPGQRAKQAGGTANAAYRTIKISLTYGLSG